MRPALRFLHVLAGGAALVIILSFLGSSAYAELYRDASAIASVKAWIVSWLLILIVALATTGGSGFALAGSSPRGLAARKMGRMRFVAANGIFILIPAAIFLDWKAEAGEFDATFVALQTIEYLAGLTNIALISLNFRDGLFMTRRLAGTTSISRS